ncbi:hypothetical protein Mal15_30150 [Stieleria maiorica]|uniref:Uncharacterized protein n=1 Tax=Stieleria maiorica TaxID=2795974 RepID=A0A5B9MIV4_9BACT|nr:hypothetical protein [Stieleria maiorica]QEF98957.1 hypothetical protein Mal15_30150 [Stieleria maiorica]
MATRFIFNPPVEASDFDDKISLDQHPEHRIVKQDGATVIDALAIATDSDAEILNLQQELARLFGTVTVQRGVELDAAD